MNIPNEIKSGVWQEGHVQGIAIDEAKGHVYFSFTTLLLKTDLAGNPIGSVKNLAGHLGCIVIDPERRRVCGSLELKHDVIGAGIIKRIGYDPSAEDNFYLVAFDIDKIDRMDMDAEADGIMTAVWLGDVAADYAADDPASGKPHRYGCSGIDGTALGPVFGAPADSPKKLMITYGVYSDVEREDNNYQVVLQYDPSVIDAYGCSLNQAKPHHNGPSAPEARYFVYTGNTSYGVQNIEYDAASRLWLTAVYVGKKPQFPNYSMYFIDGTAAPRIETLKGRGDEQGAVLTLADPAGVGGDTPGCRFPYGATGMYADGKGHFCFSKPGHNKEDKTFHSTVLKYKMDKANPDVFVLYED